MSVMRIRYALAAVAATAALGAGAAPANAVYQCVSTPTVMGTNVKHCQDVVVVNGGIVTTAGDLYFCVNGSCNNVHLDRNGAGVNTATRQVCYILAGGGYVCF